MPPTLALILCTTFVVAIFRLARKGADRTSFALWIPTIWIMYCASRPFSDWLSLQSPTDSIEEGSSIDRIILVILIIIGGLILKKRALSWSAVMRENRWLVFLCAYILISILWADHTQVSLKRAIRFVATPMMAFVVLTEAKPTQAMEAIFRRTAYILVPFSLLLIKYFPDLGDQYDLWIGQRMWVGVTTQKNSLGRLCLISAFFLMWAIQKAWPHRKSLGVKGRLAADLAVLFITLLILRGPGGAYSATSIAALLIGVALYQYLRWLRKHDLPLQSNLLLVVIIVAIAFGLLIPLGSVSAGFVSILGRDQTFTGRTEIWQAILPVAWRSPIIGVGYGEFWIKPPISYNLSIMVNEAHNGFLDIFTELGLVGLAIFIGFILSSCRMAQRAMSNDFAWGAFAFSFFLIAVVHNITESSFLRTTNHMGAMVFFLSIFAANLSRTSGEARIEMLPFVRVASPSVVSEGVRNF